MSITAETWTHVENEESDALWRQRFDDCDPPQCWQHRNGLTALIGREPLAPDDWRWHLSLRYGNPDVDGRVPSWGELVQAAHELRPGVVFVIGVPPRSWWINVHPHVLHLWETRDDVLVSQWRAERQGTTPT